MDRVRWGSTPRLLSQPCRSTWHPQTPSLEGRWRTWSWAAHGTLFHIHHLLSFFKRFYLLLLLLLLLLLPGCISRWGFLSLGVPAPAGVHHGSSAGGLDHSPDRPNHLGCIRGHGLVRCQPEPGTESGLGRWWENRRAVKILPQAHRHFNDTFVLFYRWRRYVWLSVNLPEQLLILFLHWQVILKSNNYFIHINLYL